MPNKTMYVYFRVETTPPHCEWGKVLILLRGVAVSTPPAVSMIQGRFERNSCHRHRQIQVQKAEVKAFKTCEGDEFDAGRPKPKTALGKFRFKRLRWKRLRPVKEMSLMLGDPSLKLH